MNRASRSAHYVVVGLGKTGLSCVRYCLRKGIPVAVTDSRKEPPGREALKALAPDLPVAFGELSSALILKAGQLILSPGISLNEPIIAEAIKKKIPFVGDIELFVQEVHAPIIAITGSNAKSTVTALVGEMAEASGLNVKVAGNIGVPVLDLLEEPEADLYVLELSSFQLETTHSLHAKVASILNISEDHMDRYANMSEYITAKQRIYQNAKNIVTNRADPNTLPVPVIPAQPVIPAKDVIPANPVIPSSAVIPAKAGTHIPETLQETHETPRHLTFGLNEPKENEYGVKRVRKETYLARGKNLLIPIKSIKIKGMHNIENALASLTIGEAAGFKTQAMLETLKVFPGLPHRCQFVLESDGINWYNDSKGTNVGATVAALNGLGIDAKGKIVLIAGGIGKGADFSPLRDPMKKYVRTVILIGEAKKQLANVLDGCCEIEFAESMQQAVELADMAALRGDNILLSPACASFDMFDNYMHRGDVFMQCVTELVEDSA